MTETESMWKLWEYIEIILRLYQIEGEPDDSEPALLQAAFKYCDQYSKFLLVMISSLLNQGYIRGCQPVDYCTQNAVTNLMSILRAYGWVYSTGYIEDCELMESDVAPSYWLDHVRDMLYGNKYHKLIEKALLEYYSIFLGLPMNTNIEGYDLCARYIVISKRTGQVDDVKRRRLSNLMKHLKGIHNYGQFCTVDYGNGVFYVCVIVAPSFFDGDDYFICWSDTWLEPMIGIVLSCIDDVLKNKNPI